MIEIIPAIDIIDGNCVRLSQGDYARKTVYSADPVEMAKRFEDAGLRRLHLVDLDGAKKGCMVNVQVLERIASSTSLEIDFGGGVKTLEDAKSVLEMGAKMVTIGSVAVKDPSLFDRMIAGLGADKILLGADVKEEKIAVHGWTEQTELSVFDFIDEQVRKGVKDIFCTDISKDGQLEGSATGLYRRLAGRFPSINLVASGGISSLDDIREVEKAGCKGVIIGKAFYEGRIRPEELLSYAR